MTEEQEQAPYVDNTALVAELTNCVTNQQVTPSLLGLVRDADLYVPLHVDEPGAQPSLYAVEHEGHVLVAAFTSMETLEYAEPDAEAITVMTGGQLAAIIAENDVDNTGVRLALDIAGTGVALDPNEVLTGGSGHWHGGSVSEGASLPEGPRVYLGVPAEPPTELMNRLRIVCAGQSRVRSVHLLQAVTEDPSTPDAEPETALLVGVVLDDDTTEADEEAVLAALGPAIGEPAQPVDVMTLPETAPADEPQPGPSLRQALPFYPAG